VGFEMEGVYIYNVVSLYIFMFCHAQHSLCVITLSTTPNLPKSPQASCALLGLDLLKFVHPKKLLAQYLFLASWFSQNSL
jgi:hypothetical protein